MDKGRIGGVKNIFETKFPKIVPKIKENGVKGKIEGGSKMWQESDSLTTFMYLFLNRHP